MGAIIDYFLNTVGNSGMWTPGLGKFTATDKNGTAFGVGNTVKLLGTVSAINANSSHFDEVTITVNPVTINQSQG